MKWWPTPLASRQGCRGDAAWILMKERYRYGRRWDSSRLASSRRLTARRSMRRIWRRGSEKVEGKSPKHTGYSYSHFLVARSLEAGSRKYRRQEERWPTVSCNIITSLYVSSYSSMLCEWFSIDCCDSLVEWLNEIMVCVVRKVITGRGVLDKEW